MCVVLCVRVCVFVLLYGSCINIGVLNQSTISIKKMPTRSSILDDTGCLHQLSSYIASFPASQKLLSFALLTRFTYCYTTRNVNILFDDSESERKKNRLMK